MGDFVSWGFLLLAGWALVWFWWEGDGGTAVMGVNATETISAF